MLRGSVLFILLLFWGQDLVLSIRLLELRVPAHAAAGGDALFSCQFDMEGDLLYSVRWYKDGHEFYRYIPKNPPDQTSMFFQRPGVTVDLSRSSSDVVTLTNLQPESAGEYRCEVTGEAPVFAQATDEKYVTIHVLPKSGPRITGLRYQYEIGDRVSANCTSSGSRPEAILKWLVNNKPVHRTFLRGPWHRIVQDPQDTIETTLGLHFMVVPSHFRNGVMQIKCQVTIAPLYQREKVYILNQPEPDPDPQTSEEPPPQPDTPPVGILDEDSDEDYIDVRENLIDRFSEVTEISTTTTTETSKNSKDYATKVDIYFGLLIVALVMQVILIL